MTTPRIKPSDITIGKKEEEEKKDDDPSLQSWLSGEKPIKQGRKRIYKKKEQKDVVQFDKADPHEIGRRMRAAFWNGTMELCHRQRKALHEVIADWLERDPKGTFQMMSGFFPKQVEANIGGDLVSYLKEIERGRNNERSNERVINVQSDVSETPKPDKENEIRPDDFLLHRLD